MRLVLLFGLIIYSGQIIAQEGVVDKISGETCTCMNDKDLAEMERIQFETELGDCILSIASKYESALNETMGLSIQDQESINKLGGLVGRYIALNCSTLFAKMMDLYQEDDTSAEQPDKGQLMRYRGRFVVLSQEGTFATLHLRDEDNSVATFLWLAYFPGSEMFLGETSGLVNFMMTVTYANEELFDPLTKSYRVYKVIKRVDNQ
ncbi:MAG: hypothetical protein HRU40_15560 [Saprospiraceae bacterium]|nr:hypothetical protein [Saprospiraceae bacterium]